MSAKLNFLEENRYLSPNETAFEFSFRTPKLYKMTEKLSFPFVSLEVNGEPIISAFDNLLLVFSVR